MDRSSELGFLRVSFSSLDDARLHGGSDLNGLLSPRKLT